MKKVMRKILATGLCVMSIMATNVVTAPTALAAQGTTVRNQTVVQDLSPNTTVVNYSKLIEGDGAVNFNVKLPAGVKLTTTSANTFSKALTQNYNISISEGVHYSKENFSINVNWANDGVKYLGDWIFNISGSAFTDGKDRTFTIKVINDLASVGTPKITTNMERGVTVQQLNQGFDLVMNIENAKFNTACFGNYIRVSMINSSGLRIHPVAYCNGLKPNQVKMRVQATNGVESWRTHFEFKIEGNATNSPVPITVRIPILR